MFKWNFKSSQTESCSPRLHYAAEVLRNKCTFEIVTMFKILLRLKLPYKPCVAFFGHRQTVQTQIRRGVWSGFSLFAYLNSTKNVIKKIHQTPLKLELDKDGVVH